MGENTSISWAHKTWNPWMGCDKIAEECAHCYIGRQRCFNDERPAWGEVSLTQTWKDPGKWERECVVAGHAIRGFTCSISDFFHAKADAWRNDAWWIIRNTPHIAWLVLTKRPSRIEKHLPADWGAGYQNVWLGVSTGCKRTLVNMDVLREIPCALRWVSSEPLLEDIADDINLKGFGWVVTGGESGFGTEYRHDPTGDWRATMREIEASAAEQKKCGFREIVVPGRRTMLLTWAEKMRDKAKAAGLPFLFKQITSSNSGVAVNALGDDCHEFPAAPNGMKWAPRPPIEEKNLWSLVQIEKLKEAQGSHE
jgi:protein gp37